MTDRYAALREATADAMAVKWYFMFDNHSFLHLFADDVKASMATLRGLSAKRIAYGMLCAKGENRKHLHFHGAMREVGQCAPNVLFAYFRGIQWIDPGLGHHAP